MWVRCFRVAPASRPPRHCRHCSWPQNTNEVNRRSNLVGFDPALAARTIVSLLAAGRDPGPILAAVTGTGTGE